MNKQGKNKGKNNTEKSSGHSTNAKKISEERNLNTLESILKEKGNDYFWSGSLEPSPTTYDFRPENRNPEYSPISTTVGFTFFGNQGSVQLEEVYYHIRQSLKSLQKFNEN